MRTREERKKKSIACPKLCGEPGARTTGLKLCRRSRTRKTRFDHPCVVGGDGVSCFVGHHHHHFRTSNQVHGRRMISGGRHYSFVSRCPSCPTAPQPRPFGLRHAPSTAYIDLNTCQTTAGTKNVVGSIYDVLGYLFGMTANLSFVLYMCLSSRLALRRKIGR